METKTSRPALGFDFMPVNGARAALKIALVQAANRRNAKNYRDELCRILTSNGQPELSRTVARLADTMLLDPGFDVPSDLLLNPYSAFCSALPATEAADAEIIDEIYGRGFAELLTDAVATSEDLGYEHTGGAR